MENYEEYCNSHPSTHPPLQWTLTFYICFEVSVLVFVLRKQDVTDPAEVFGQVLGFYYLGIAL